MSDEANPPYDADQLRKELLDARIAAFRALKKKVDEGVASAADITALARMAREVEVMLPQRASMQATPGALPNYTAMKLPFTPANETEDYVSPNREAEE